MHTQHTITITVPREVRHYFRHTEIHGQGGFQSLCRQLGTRLTDTPVLTLQADEFRRIVRYATYGDGGFQSRLRRLIAQWVSTNLSSLLPS